MQHDKYDDKLPTMEEMQTKIQQLKEDDLRKVLSSLLRDNANFSLVQQAHIANVINSKLSGTMLNETVSKDGDTVDKTQPPKVCCTAISIILPTQRPLIFCFVIPKATQPEVWKITKECVSQVPRQRATTARANDSSEDTLADRSARTLLDRYEDGTTAPQDALGSLQIVNHAKMTVHYHFHDHQHVAERDTAARPVDKPEDSDHQGLIGQANTPTSIEQPEPGEIRDSSASFCAQSIEDRGAGTGAKDQAATTKKSTKRSVSETVAPNTQAHLPPAKRVKVQEAVLPPPGAPMNVHSLHALFGNPQGQAGSGGPAPRSAPQPQSQPQPQPQPQAKLQPKPATAPSAHRMKCRHCKKWFTDKENNAVACGIHKGTVLSFLSEL